MTERMRKLSRVAVAIGGFLTMMGIILMGTIALAFSNIIDVKAFANGTYILLFMMALLSIGILDILAGIILSKG